MSLQHHGECSMEGEMTTRDTIRDEMLTMMLSSQISCMPPAIFMFSHSS